MVLSISQRIGLYYKIHKDGSVDAYVQATFEIKGITHMKTLALNLIRKDSYFCERVET